MSNIVKGNLNGISSKGGYYKDGKFVPNPVSETDPLYILYGYPVASTGGGIIEAGTKSNMTYEDDGHGVITSRVTYYGSSPKEIAQGDSHPKLGSALKCIRSSVSQDGKVYTTTAEYIGLANGSSNSSVVFSGDFGVSSASIKQNPNFKTLKKDASYGWSEKDKEFLGDESDSQNVAGTKSYYVPTLTLSGYFYSNNKVTLTDMISKVGTVTNSFNIPSEDWAIYSGSLKTPTGTNRTNRFLISGVSHEKIAHLYKIKFSLIYSGDGWHNKFYKTA